MAGEAFRAAEAYRELDHLQAVEHAKRFRLPALHDEAERRARAGALLVIDRALRITLRQERRKIHPLYLRMRLQELGDGTRVVRGLVHAQRHRFERARHHPAGVRIELTAEPSA